MKDKIKEKNEVVEIDLKQIWFALIGRIWVLLLTAFIGAAVFFAGTKFLITPEYKAYAQFYVNNNSLSVGDTSFSLSSSDIMASKSLVDTYIVILRSRSCLNDVIDYAGVDYSYGQVRGMLSAYSVNETEVFEVAVTSVNPDEAEKIANSIAYILPKKIASIVEGTSASIVDYAVRPSSPSSPNITKNTMIGFILGFAFLAAIIVIRTIFDVTIRGEDDITQNCDHPVLASVPDMAVHSKGGYYYGKYGKRRGYYSSYAYASASKKAKAKAANSNTTEEIKLIGKDISFAASEAYKLLRTKLQFSFVDEINCPIIGVSSAMAGEGKSLSAINLAYSLAQLDKKVLIIDCDMRRPSIFTKLPVQKSPGLSNYLTSQVHRDEIVQKCNVDGEQSFDVIASGNNPPNPIELISSAKMAKVLNSMRDNYDYIIIDLPPVGEVSDALVAAKLVDGMLLVVRQDYCTTVALSDAVEQFEFVESKILGMVMNCISEGGSKYGKRYYKKYYSKYKYHYHNYAYAAASARARKRHSTDTKKD